MQHAAAALLLKEKKRGTLHDDFDKAIGGIEHLVERLEESIRVGGRSGKGKRLKSACTFPSCCAALSAYAHPRARRALWHAPA